MAWYEAHQTMAKHPKTLKLARLLKADRRYAVGLLHDLFSWALDVAGKYGELPGMTAEDIAAALDMPGKKGLAAVTDLVDVGYLEINEAGNYCIHDWYDYAGKLMDKREADKERKAEIRANRKRKSADCPPDVQRTSGGIPLVTVPNLTYTVPNPTVEDNLSVYSEKERKNKERKTPETLAAEYYAGFEGNMRRSKALCAAMTARRYHSDGNHEAAEQWAKLAETGGLAVDRETFEYKWAKETGDEY